MSEEEKFTSNIQEIKTIYLYLIQGEPTPDDEITAREKLMKMIRTLKTLNTSKAETYIDLFEDTLNKLESWDTLELWFVESNLLENIEKIINITDKIPEIQPREDIKESKSTQIHEDLERASIDINEIVDKVSEQFKGEIEDLKQKIEFLKLELEAKDEKLAKASRMKIIKKITPKKDVKLPPPKIKLPAIKTQDKSQEKIGIKSIRQVQAKIEQEIARLTKPLDSETTSKSESLKPRTIKEPSAKKESILDILEESGKPKDIPIPHEISKLPKKPPSMEKVLEKSKMNSQIPEPTELTELPKKPRKSTLISEIIEIEDSKEDESVPFAVKAPKIEEQAVNKHTPKIVQKPKITAVRIEEIEAESVKPTGTELFNVFSSVGEKTTEKVPTLDETIKKVELKEKKIEEKIEIKKSDALPFVDFGVKSSKNLIDDLDVSIEKQLPSDKDSLYQELIALEGKRYSLEKGFKEIEKSYNLGAIDDFEYKKQSEDLKRKLEGITSRINKLRRVISSL
ncbi:MAG: hypothetical protein ACFFBK_12305 [Promethearchaeota archaeon]